MKRRRAIFIALIFLLVSLASHAAPNVYRLAVDGLACPFCTYGIEKTLSNIDGVKAIDVDLEKGQVIVTMTEGARLSEERARQAVTEAGFTLRAFTQSTGVEKE